MWWPLSDHVGSGYGGKCLVPVDLKSYLPAFHQKVAEAQPASFLFSCLLHDALPLTTSCE